MGIERSVAWAFLGMDSRASGKEDMQRSTLLSFNGVVHAGHARKRFCEACRFATDSKVPLILGAEEGLRRTSMALGLSVLDWHIPRPSLKMTTVKSVRQVLDLGA